MSLLGEVIQDGSNSPTQSKGPAILLPHEALGNVVAKTNNLLLEHRDWLANLPQRKERIKQKADAVVPPSSLITPPPSLDRQLGTRQLAVLPECNSISASASLAGASSASAQFSVSLSSVSSTCSVTSASLQAALVSAQGAFASAQLSAAAALSTAAASARAISVNASIAIVSASSSASSAISSVQSSASIAIGSAQSSASAAILAATNSLTSVQASASAAISSANAAASSANNIASEARVTASLAIQSAQASVVAAQQQASATRVAAMNETVLALTITFSVLGSSLISILIYYLISRYRRQRRERKQSELKEKIHRLRHESDGSMAPSLSAFPMPVGRKSWLSRSRPDTVETAQVTGTETGMLSGSPTLLNSGPLPGSATRQTWAPSREGRERRGNRSQGDIDFGFGGSNSSPKETRKTWAAREMIPEERPGMVRKNTLTYDPEHPERPPKFTTWLEDSFRSVSPFPDMEDEKFAGMAKRRSSYLGNGPNWQKKQSLIQRRRSKSMGEISDIGTAI